MRPEPQRRAPMEPRDQAAIALAAVSLVVSPFAAALTLPLTLAHREWPGVLAWVALAGAALCAAAAPFAYAEARAGFTAFLHPGAVAPIGCAPPAPPPPPPRPPPSPGAWRDAAEASRPGPQPRCRLAAPARPVALAAAVGAAARVALRAPARGTLVEEQRRAERAEWRRGERARRRARRRAHALAEPARAPTLGRSDDVALLGAKVSGELVLPARRGAVGLPLKWLKTHVLVIGPSGTGKTETLLRLAYGAAAVGRWPIYYIDAKADRDGAERFRALMAAAGRRCAVFPDQALDCFRGDGRAIYNRLIELVAFSAEGDGAFYRDVAKRCLWLACRGAGEPPRSSAELLARLTPDSLLALDAERGELARLGQRELAGVGMRYASFFDSIAGALDRGFGFEDVESAYVMLDSLALKEDAQSLARLLVEDFAHFATKRRQRDEPALLIVDEFSAIAEAARIVDLVERLRAFNVGVVLAPQVEPGDEDRVADRIVQNSETVILHASKRPERIIELAGTRRELEASYQHDRATATGMGSARAARLQGRPERGARAPARRVLRDPRRRRGAGAGGACAGERRGDVRRAWLCRSGAASGDASGRPALVES